MASGGTLIGYQGYRGTSVVFRRSRGYQADATVLEFPVASFPDGFDFSTPKVDEVLKELDPQVPSLAGLRTDTPKPLALQNRLDFAGTLVMAEAADKDWQVVIHPLFVKRVELVRQGGAVALVRVSLVDERFLWSRGSLRRWSYNRVRADGTVALDSVGSDGKALSLDKIAAEVVAELPRAPKLAATPAGWEKKTGQQEFPPYAPPLVALAEISATGKALDPCLRLDGAVALHVPGDGKVGWSPNGKGPNTQELPAELNLDKGGAGKGYAVEALYPDDYVKVVGGPRVATAALDHAEPVLVIRERVYPLTEHRVRDLTEGRFGLTWLHRFVMQPAQNQATVLLPDSVSRIFREQAYRLFRVPGVETYVTTADGDSLGRVGPNARLLPLLPRAEVEGGKRIPVTVETFTHAQVQREAHNGGPLKEQVAIADNRTKMKTAERLLTARARGGGPFGYEGSGEVASVAGLEVISVAARRGMALYDGLSPFLSSSISSGAATLSELQTMLDKARRIDRAKAIDSTLAAEIEAAWVAILTARDAMNGGAWVEAYQMAKLAVEYEKKVEEGRNGVLGGGESQGDAWKRQINLRNDFRRDLLPLARKAATKREQAEQVSSIGGNVTVLRSASSAKFMKNLDRREDARATLYSAELGIVKTSDLAGWVTPEGVADRAACTFVPKPVRIVFGTVLRPRSDVPPGRSVSQEAPTSTGESYVPAVGTDRESYYVRAFKRAGKKAEPLDPEKIPAGAATVVSRRDLVELIPLPAQAREPSQLERELLEQGKATAQQLGLLGGAVSSNAAELDKVATDLAESRLSLPERVEGRTLVMARPWPVQCDGVVAEVQIRSRPNGSGFETTIVSGGESAPSLSPLKTRTRPRAPKGPSDGATREGLT